MKNISEPNIQILKIEYTESHKKDYAITFPFSFILDGDYYYLSSPKDGIRVYSNFVAPAHPSSIRNFDRHIECTKKEVEKAFNKVVKELKAGFNQSNIEPF
jgi:hypothetical protein